MVLVMKYYGKDVKVKKFPENPIDGLKIRHRKFIKEYIKQGIAWKAYKKSYGCADSTAMAEAPKLMKRLKEVVNAYYEFRGLGENWITQKLLEAGDATKLQFYKGEQYETPDHYARLKAAELVKKWKDGEEGKNLNQTNVIVNIDKEKNIYEVTDGETL
jgi:hypothetical protein